MSAATRRKFTASSDYAGAFVGWVTDSANGTAVTAGTATHSTTSGYSAFDWRSFINLSRAWLLSSTNVTDTGAAGRCRDGQTCGVFDFALRKTDAVFLNRADMAFDTGTSAWTGDSTTYVDGSLSSWSGVACPAAVHGNKALTFGSKTFLLNAAEILDDGIGNDDGLCQTNEACVYMPNAGGYQGHGGLSAGTCTFASGTVSGVNLYAPVSNGY